MIHISKEWMYTLKENTLVWGVSGGDVAKQSKRGQSTVRGFLLGIVNKLNHEEFSRQVRGGHLDRGTIRYKVREVTRYVRYRRVEIERLPPWTSHWG